MIDRECDVAVRVCVRVEPTEPCCDAVWLARPGPGWREPLPGARRAGGRAFTQGGIAAYRGGTNPISEFAHTTNHIFRLNNTAISDAASRPARECRRAGCRVARRARGVVKLCAFVKLGIVCSVSALTSGASDQATRAAR